MAAGLVLHIPHTDSGISFCLERPRVKRGVWRLVGFARNVEEARGGTPYLITQLFSKAKSTKERLLGVLIAAKVQRTEPPAFSIVAMSGVITLPL